MKAIPLLTKVLAERTLDWVRGRAPKAGVKAPDFTLQRLGSQKMVSLSSFRTARPVMLIFGSYT